MPIPLDDAFHLLDLEREASLSDAKKARRELAMVWHPDRFPENQELQSRAVEKIKRINEAYEQVTDYLRVSAPSQQLMAKPAATEAPEAARKTVTLCCVPTDETRLSCSLGLEVGGDRFAEILTTGSTVPCAAAKTFTNARDFQEALTIRVICGDGALPASSADGLGRVTFVDLPPRPRGFLRMQVVFAIDDKGTVAIGATDLDSGEPVLVSTD
ncbi:J domain-containing protein [Rubricoccus marinus]|uniref:J domain-containing protein n=1 Tax=Rubricoccus marinus TaxID=716817 RepID=A0A259TZM3_9BACT|nr:J domain-containing protein [Rubricoccus marinus]OZC03202.1 hypothetical protein BSZ36_09580 [Rubricoccus marinus]